MFQFLTIFIDDTQEKKTFFDKMRKVVFQFSEKHFQIFRQDVKIVLLSLTKCNKFFNFLDNKM